METTKKVEPQKKYTAQEFADAYQKLCDEYEFRIVVAPAYIARDDGTFSTQLQYTIGALPRKEVKQYDKTVS